MLFKFSLFLASLLVASACPIFDSTKSSMPMLSDEILTGLGRLSNPSHPEIRRRLSEGPADLVPAGLPDRGGSRGDMPNNTFRSNGLGQVVYRNPTSGASYTLAEIIALYSQGKLPGREDGPGVGQELCYWSFQSLPPPLRIEDQSQVVPRTVDGVDQVLYNFPKADLQRYVDLADQAVTRLNTFIEKGNPHLVFATGASGSESSKALCEEDVHGTEGSQCDEPRLNNKVTWPQAIAIFKIDPAKVGELNSFISNDWRDSPDGHRANIVWTYYGGMNYTEPGNEDFGGIQSSIHAGWGTNGGLRAKVVQCDQIDAKFLSKSHGVRGMDAIDSDTGLTYGEVALVEWERLCGIPFGTQDSDCVVDANDGVAPEEPAVATALLPFDEACVYEPEFVSDSARCGALLDDALGNRTTEQKFADQREDLLAQCGRTFCDSLDYAEAKGSSAAIDGTGFLYCQNEGYRSPANCDEGTKYMKALKDIVHCSMKSEATVSAKKKEASETASSTSAGASLEACKNMIQCEERVLTSVTNDWRTRFCVNFFSALRNPDVNDEAADFGWVEECGFKGDGSKGSEVYDNCAAIFSPADSETSDGDPSPKPSVISFAMFTIMLLSPFVM